MGEALIYAYNLFHFDSYYNIHLVEDSYLQGLCHDSAFLFEEVLLSKAIITHF